MDALWPWLAIGGMGALHGLNPTTGWMLAAAAGLRSGDRSRALRALWPIGLGHGLSVLLVALLVVGGLPLVDRSLMRYVVGAALLVAVAMHFWRRAPRSVRVPAGRIGMALWSFLASSLHGAGLMLVPALVPLCMTGSGAAVESSPLLLALCAMLVHSAAMLLVTGLVAFGLCCLRGVVVGGGAKGCVPLRQRATGLLGWVRGLCTAVRACHWGGRRFAPTSLRCSRSWPCGRTRDSRRLYG